jgi:hypothetical protein
MNIITKEILQQAIENKIGLHPTQAKHISMFIMEIFGYETRIIDNILNTDKRQIFYMLEGENILSTSREQTRLYDGRAWMIHYWQLNTAVILRYSNQNGYKSMKKTTSKTNTPTSIYSTLSEEKWFSRKIIDRDPFASI